MGFFVANKRRYTVSEAAGIMARAPGFFWSEDDAKQVIGHLIQAGKLAKSGKLFWKGAISIGRKARDGGTGNTEPSLPSVRHPT